MLQRLIHHATGTEFPLSADKEKQLVQRMKGAGSSGSSSTDGAASANASSSASSADDAAAASSSSSGSSLASSSAATNPSADASEPPKSSTAWLAPCSVALICRIKSNPYIWCGELEFVRFVPGTHPLQFVWRLKDFDQLASAPGSLFGAVVAESGEKLASVATGGAGTGGGGAAITAASGAP